MTEQAHAEPFMFPRAALMRMRGRFATVRYATPGGIRITRSGEIAGTGLKNVTVVVASGRIYKIPIAAILAVESPGAAVAVETMSDSMRLCMTCACSYARSGRRFCSADMDMKSSVTDSTICGGYEERNGRWRHE